MFRGEEVVQMNSECKKGKNKCTLLLLLLRLLAGRAKTTVIGNQCNLTEDDAHFAL